jgi:predicted nucleotidyltransferase
MEGMGYNMTTPDTNLDYDCGGRKELFRALTGSHNYNLDTPESNKDYNIFVLPTFDDLYYKNEFSRSDIGETINFSIHDIRKANYFWLRSKINFLEVLFSDNICINQELDPKILSNLDTIFYHKNDIAKMNLRNLFNTCAQMYFHKKGQINSGTENTQNLIDKYGYDTKQAMDSLRILDFLHRYADNEFTDFKKAIYYQDGEESREKLLNIRNGLYPKKIFDEILTHEFELIESKYRDKYASYKPDMETYDYVMGLIQGIVRIGILSDTGTKSVNV